MFFFHVLVDFHVLGVDGSGRSNYVGPCLMGWAYAGCISHFLMHDNHTPVSQVVGRLSYESIISVFYIIFKFILFRFYMFLFPF